MSRLIDADALIEKVNEKKPIGRFTLVEYLKNAPTVARTERPFVMIEGKAIYITQGHIDAMVEYERKEQVKEVVERFMKSLEEKNDISRDIE